MARSRCCLFAGALSSARVGGKGRRRERGGGGGEGGGVTSPVPRNILQTRLRLATKLCTVFSSRAAAVSPAGRLVPPREDTRHFRNTVVVVVIVVLVHSAGSMFPSDSLCLCVAARRWDIRSGGSVGGGRRSLVGCW